MFVGKFFESDAYFSPVNVQFRLDEMLVRAEILRTVEGRKIRGVCHYNPSVIEHLNVKRPDDMPNFHMSSVTVCRR